MNLKIREMANLISINHDRYGFCVPFYPDDNPTVCDNVYEPGIDYVYVPYTRSGGKYGTLIGDMAQFGPLFFQSLATCDLPVDQLLCHYYLPPCGNVTHYEPPTAVCPEVCTIFVEQCPNEWAAVVQYFKQSGQVVIESGLQFINCSSPGQYLAPLPHCCTDAGLNISKYIGMSLLHAHCHIIHFSHAHSSYINRQ